MIYQIIVLSTILIAGLLEILFLKNKRVSLILRYIAGALVFLSYASILFSPSRDNGNIHEVFMDTVSIIKGRYDSIFTRAQSITILIVLFLMAIAFSSTTVSLFFNGKGLRLYNIFIVPISITLLLVFFNLMHRGYVGDFIKYSSLKKLLLFIYLESLGLFFVTNLNYEIKFKMKEERITVNSILRAVAILPAFIFLYMPISTLYNLFGQYGLIAEEFNKEHILIIVFILLSFFIIYFSVRNQDIRSKSVIMMLYGLSAFNQYFSAWYDVTLPMSSLPLHICNTAVILMPLSLAFKRKRLFYFTYFVNVLGALFATFSVSTSDLFYPTGLEYYYNHAIDIIFPLMCVLLGIFERPTLRNMVQAMVIFSIYIVIAQIFGALVNVDLDPTVPGIQRVDFFFLYGTKFEDIKMLTKMALKLKYDFIIRIPYNNHIYYIYPLYTLGIYLVFIAMSFMMWFLYDRVYLAREDIHLMVYKTKLKKEKLGKISRKELEDIKNTIGGKTMIKISHFSKKYGSAKDYSVKDFSLTIEDGDVFGFIGHNGAGKSTVIKSLVGIQSITEGNIEVCGYDIEKYPLQAKLNIGYVSDNHAVYEKLTGREYINYVAELYQVSKEDREKRTEYYSKMFGLTDALDREAKSYSHGMKQKLVVISSLIHDPKVWVLDEPLTGLDPTSSFQIKECMREHASKGNIVFFSTHVIEVIEKLCTKIAIISHGKLMGVYKIDDLKKEGISLESLYLKYVVSDDDRGTYKEEDIATTDAGLIIEKK